MPGTIIAASRLDRPSLMIYGGTIKPGSSKAGEPLDIVSAFQSYGAFFFLSFFHFFFSFFSLFLFFFFFIVISDENNKAPSLVKQSALPVYTFSVLRDGKIEREGTFFCRGRSNAYAHSRFPRDGRK